MFHTSVVASVNYVPIGLVLSETLYHIDCTLLMLNHFASVQRARMNEVISRGRWRIVLHILCNRWAALHPNKG